MLTWLEHGRCSIHGRYMIYTYFGWKHFVMIDIVTPRCMGENYTEMYECTEWGPVSGF
jgi:hypothetical protein